jgi:hypothetical protein
LAASVSLRVYTGSGAGTQSAAQTGISFLSIDSAANDATTRQNNPVDVGTVSFEKWMALVVDVAPANAVANFQWWTDGSGPSNVALKYGTTGTGVTPKNTTSTVATNDAFTATSGSPATWHAGSLTTVGQRTDFLVMQLQPASNAAAGNIPTETISYKYQET